MLRIAIVGRPNVGKSAIFNRMAGKRVAIVHDMPGVTRDRISVVVPRDGKEFELVDTGGIGLFESQITPGLIASAVQMQADIAIEGSDVILFVVDGLAGLSPLDQEISAKLRKSGKKPWLLVNKLDLPQHEIKASEFSSLGISSVYPVSAAHGRGFDELWTDLFKIQNITDGTQKDRFSEEVLAKSPRIVVVGRPNVGKSSMINRLLGAERVIVSEIPGTTRDPIELPLEFGKQTYVLIDTAGVRQKAKIDSYVEMYSREGTEKTIKKADIVLLMMESSQAATRQDREIAGMIEEHRKPCIQLINKWDLNETIQTRHVDSKGGLRKIKVKSRSTSRSEFESEVRYRMPFLDYAPMLFVSALEGYHAVLVWKEIQKVRKASQYRFTTGVLNRVFLRAQQKVQAPLRSGKRLKIYYVIQKQETLVPTFVLFVNHPKYLTSDYERYLKNQLREESKMEGCPIIFQVRARVGSEEGRSSHPEKIGIRDLPE